jgi:hypothetical protein
MGRWVRKISRRRRRTRMRSTAPPILREVMRPQRTVPVSGMRRAVNRRNRPCRMMPAARTCANSPEVRNRRARGNRSDSRSGSGVAGVVDFDALWKEAFASMAAAAVEDGASALCLHPGAESKLPFARALGWLIRAFHRTENVESVNLSGTAALVNAGHSSSGKSDAGKARYPVWPVAWARNQW